MGAPLNERETMKQVIMTRELILHSTEHIIHPYTRTEQREIWDSFGEHFWNEFYRVGVYDTDKYTSEIEALADSGREFTSHKEALEYYEQLTKELKESK